MFLVLAINCLFNKEMLSYDSLVSTLARYQWPSHQASCVNQGPGWRWSGTCRTNITRSLSEVWAVWEEKGERMIYHVSGLRYCDRWWGKIKSSCDDLKDLQLSSNPLYLYNFLLQTAGGDQRLPIHAKHFYLITKMIWLAEVWRPRTTCSLNFIDWSRLL